VARAAADLVLLNDDFVSIVATVREGRHLFAKIQTSFLYLLAFHVPIVALALLAPLFRLPLLLLPVHLVWLELVVHPVSAFAFEGEPAAPDLMRRAPRAPSAPLLPRASTARSLTVGAILAIAVFVLYRASLSSSINHARAIALAALFVGYQIVALLERAALTPRGVGFFPHTMRFWAVWIVSGATLIFALYVPAITRALSLAPINVRDWGVAACVALVAVGWRFVADVRARTQ
jgi:Ca2+-transporting ATPase